MGNLPVIRHESPDRNIRFMYSSTATRRRRLLLVNSSRAASAANRQVSPPHPADEIIGEANGPLGEVANEGSERAPGSFENENSPPTLLFPSDATVLSPGATTDETRRELVPVWTGSPAVRGPYALLAPCDPTRVIEISLTSTLTGKVETVQIDAPLLVVGRGSQCDLRLTHPDVSRRHACIHLLRDRALCVDLGSRTGIHWNEERRQSGWLDAGSVVRIGPFELRLAGSPPATFDTDELCENEPFDTDVLFRRQAFGEAGPGLRFLNQSAPAPPVSLERPITLIGRTDPCKLRLRDESVSRVHSSVMVTPDGVWIADLLGRGGVKVNGEFVSLSRLSAGDVIQIGRYRFAFVTDLAPVADESSRSSRSANVSQGDPGPSFAGPTGGVSESLLLAVTETFADMQRQMNDQFRYQMELMAGLIESMRKEMSGEIRQELARLMALGEEIRDTQRLLAAPPVPATDVANAARSEPRPSSSDRPHAAAGTNKVDANKAAGTNAASKAAKTSNRFTSSGTGVDPDRGDGIADHVFMTRRLRDLEHERNSRWERLVGLLKGES